VGISPSESDGAPPPRLDTSTAHSARVWNYLLRGKDNFAADRAIGDVVLQTFPDIAQQVAPESRIVYVDNDPLVLVHAR
jgi:hypothetical protein